jgi:hypothetical protein
VIKSISPWKLPWHPKHDVSHHKHIGTPPNRHVICMRCNVSTLVCVLVDNDPQTTWKSRNGCNPRFPDTSPPRAMMTWSLDLLRHTTSRQIDDLHMKSMTNKLLEIVTVFRAQSRWLNLFHRENYPDTLNMMFHITNTSAHLPIVMWYVWDAMWALWCVY